MVAGKKAQRRERSGTATLPPIVPWLPCRARKRNCLPSVGIRNTTMVSSKLLWVSAGCCSALATAAALACAYQWSCRRRRWRRARARWAALGRDVVVLHQFPRPPAPSADRANAGRGFCALSPSPFPAKLETWLRVAGVEYVNDFDFPQSPVTGKSPWVTLNGEDMADSQVVVEALAKRGGKDLSSNLSPKERAVARSFRLLLEDHFYWAGLISARCVGREARDLRDFLPRSSQVDWNADRRAMGRTLRAQALAQGVLRLDPGWVQKTAIEDLEAISTFLGSKSYVMGGDKPTELDCVLFGFVQCLLLTAQTECIYKTLLEKRLTNLQQHFHRIKAKFYPDWTRIMSGEEEEEGELGDGQTEQTQ